MYTVLAADDEADILELVSINLRRQHFKVITAADGITAVQMAREQLPDAIILDLMLPGLDGFGVFKELRGDPRTAGIPVIMLTARAAVNDRIAGLELGADDYVTKPFSPRELTLRVEAVLKRRQPAAGGGAGGGAVLSVGDFQLDRNSLRLMLAGRRVDLTATEFKLLRLLVEAQDKLQERDLLLREVWGYSDTTLTRTLDTHIKRLREKLETHAVHIQTVRGFGYRFTLNPGAGAE